MPIIDSKTGKIRKDYTVEKDIVINPKHAYTKQLIKDVPKLSEAWDLS